MLQLAELQTHLFAAIYPTTNNTCLQLPNALLEINPERLDIYRHSVLGTLQKALAAIFPACKALVGEAFFMAMAAAYIRLNPSHTRNLIEYGTDFPEFIKTYSPAQSLAYLTDIAQLECLVHQIFYSADNSPLDFDRLNQAITQYNDHIIFLAPTDSVLLKSEYPVQNIWEVCQPDYTGEINFNLDSGPIYLQIWQQNYRITMANLSAAEFLLLQLLHQKLPLFELCERFTLAMPEANVAEILPGLFQRGCINGFTVSPTLLLP